MMGRKKVRIYTTEDCGNCKELTEYLDSRGVKFKKVNLSRNPDRAKELKEKIEEPYVPVICVGNGREDICETGFDKKEIDSMLGFD